MKNLLKSKFITKNLLKITYLNEIILDVNEKISDLHDWKKKEKDEFE